MGHCIRAIIGAREAVRKIADDWVFSKEIVLPQGFGMIFCTTELLEDIEELSDKADNAPDFTELDYFDASVRELMESYSQGTKLAYVETDYFGGTGTQAGILYEDGRPVAPKSGEGAINSLLMELGVRREHNKDEFDMLSLGKYRHME